MKVLWREKWGDLIPYVKIMKRGFYSLEKKNQFFSMIYHFLIDYLFVPYIYEEYFFLSMHISLIDDEKILTQKIQKKLLTRGY